jgi:hypothetical protein
MKALFKLLICFGILPLFSSAQSNIQDQLSMQIDKAININTKLFETHSEYQNKNFVFSISITIGQKGMIKDVIYSAYSQELLKNMIDFKKATKQLKADRTIYADYKNCSFIKLITFIHGDAARAINGDDLQKGWEGIAITTDRMQKKNISQIFLVPDTYKVSATSIFN